MDFTILFENGTLIVKDADGIERVNQPFKPTSTGEQLPWESAEEARQWFEIEIKPMLGGNPA